MKDAELVDLFVRFGLPVPEVIARDIRRNEQDAQSFPKARKTSSAVGRAPSVSVEEILEQYLSGLTMQAVGQKYGVTKQEVSRRLIANGYRVATGRMIKNETGNRYGMLTVIGQADAFRWGSACWVCKCDCGRERVVIGKSLRAGLTRSCGRHHRRGPAPTVLSEEILEQYLSGLTMKVIGQKHGVTQQEISRRLIAGGHRTKKQRVLPLLLKKKWPFELR